MMAYNLGLVAGECTLRVVGKHHLIVDDGGKTQGGTTSTFLVCGEQIFQYTGRHISHALNSTLERCTPLKRNAGISRIEGLTSYLLLRIGPQATATYVVCHKSKVAVRRIADGDGRERRAGIHDQPCDDVIIRVGIRVLIHADRSNLGS